MSEQRRLVTVLFADIVGSTPFTVARDPEVVRAALRRTFDELRPIIESHGGTVEKFIGDEVMAVFGVPRAHDDDADRAVRAAFAIHRRMHELNEQPGAARFELRIGLNTGETVAGSGEGREFLVTGEPVIAAARLRAGAQPGEIGVGALTQTLTKHGVSYGPERKIDAKGLGQLTLWPALELRSEVPVAQRGLPGLRAPLIGRDQEERLLRQTFERVGVERTPSLVTLFGAAGAGKSRLIAEFVASQGTSVVRFGRCLPYGDGITFYPVQQILRADLGIELSTDRNDAIATVRSTVDASVDTSERDAVATSLEVVLALRDPSQTLNDSGGRDLMHELRWGVRRYFERRVRSPMVLVFEDLHWAEPALIALIDHLAEWVRAPVLLLCSARLEFRDEYRTFGVHAANSIGITLTPLDASDTERLVSELLRVEDLPVALREEIVRKTEGNPLYVEEFLRTLIETGQLERHGDRWTANAQVADLGVPRSLQGLITARLDRASLASRRLLQSASIVGRLFSTAGLAAISGEPPNEELLLDARRRDLIVEVDETAPGAGRVHSFKHPLFRDVAYSTIPKAERVNMHANYARWLEETLAGRAEELPEIVAYHAEQAYVYAAELGDARASVLGPKALDLLIAVADRARGRGDAHASRGLYARASAIADATNAASAKRVHARAFALFTDGSTGAQVDDESRRQLRELLAEARTLPPTEVLLWLLNSAAVRAYQEGDNPQALRLTSELAAAARAIGDPGLLAHWLGECAERAEWCREHELAESYLREAVEAGRRATSAFHRLMPLMRMAGRALTRGDYVQAADLESEIAGIDFSQSAFARATSWRGAAARAYSRGQFDTSIAFATKAIDAYRELGAPRWMTVVCQWRLGDSLLAQNRIAEARAVLEDGAAQAIRLGLLGQIPELSARSAIACVRSGEVDAAQAHLTDARKVLVSDDDSGQRITAMADAELSAATGDLVHAERVLSNAAERLADSALRFEAAQLDIALGELFLKAGRHSDARDRLTRARAFFAGAVPRGWQEYIDQRLARAGAPVA